jgi:hypothetical protein
MFAQSRGWSATKSGTASLSRTVTMPSSVWSGLELRCGVCDGADTGRVEDALDLALVVPVPARICASRRRWSLYIRLFETAARRPALKFAQFTDDELRGFLDAFSVLERHGRYLYDHARPFPSATLEAFRNEVERELATRGEAAA